jgi:glycosyltransferase domain-containing protein
MITSIGLTILVFSYNRPRYLQRTINYYSGTAVPVIIADGSSEPLLCDLPANVIYLHRPNASLLERVRELLKTAKTPYVVLGADDDFIAIEGVTKVTNFLVSNCEYASAQGFYTRFQTHQNSKRVFWRQDYQYAAAYSFEQETATERFAAAMKPPIMHYCYSVMKKEAMSSALDLMDQVQELSVSTFELSFIPALMAAGKHKALPIFFVAREAHSVNWGGGLVFSSWAQANSSTGYARWKQNICALLFSEVKPDARQNACLDSVLKAYLTSSAENVKESRGSSVDASGLKRWVKQIQIARSAFFILRSYSHIWQMFRLRLGCTISFVRDWGRMKACIAIYLAK